MLSRESLERQFQGLSQEDSLRILAEEHNIYYNLYSPINIFWFARVFTACSSDDLEEQINEFLWFINFIVVPITRTCFHEERTVTIGENCCGCQTTTLYFTLKRIN